MAEDAVFQAGNSLFGDIMVLDYSRFSAPHIYHLYHHTLQISRTGIQKFVSIVWPLKNLLQWQSPTSR